MGPVRKSSREGAKIRQARLRAGLTQEEVARRVGVTTHTIWRLENLPTFNPRIQTLRAIAKVLGLDVCHILSST